MSRESLQERMISRENQPDFTFLNGYANCFPIGKSTRL